MAHIKAYKRASTGALRMHCNRERGQIGGKYRYGNQDIKPEYFEYNRRFPGDKNFRLSDPKYWIERQERETGKAVRKDANVLASVVITLPEQYKDYPYEQQVELLQQAGNYCFSVFGKKVGNVTNLVYLDLHFDETTPHLHFGFVPLDDRLHINSKKVLNRRVFQRFHEGLDEYLSEHLDFYHGGVLLTDDQRQEKYGFKDKSLWGSNLTTRSPRTE